MSLEANIAATILVLAFFILITFLPLYVANTQGHRHGGVTPATEVAMRVIRAVVNFIASTFITIVQVIGHGIIVAVKAIGSMLANRMNYIDQDDARPTPDAQNPIEPDGEDDAAQYISSDETKSTSNSRLSNSTIHSDWTVASRGSSPDPTGQMP